MIEPTTIEELAAALRDAGSSQKTVNVLGNNSKRLMAGPLLASDVTISTARLNRILDYEPRDLTISVEAGITYSELSRALTPNRQMIPLDPPWADTATIGGIVNLSNNLMGVAAPVITGFIVGLTHSFAGAFLVAGLVLLVGIFSYAVVLGKIEPIPEPTAISS